jgi:hypothetical protein
MTSQTSCDTDLADPFGFESAKRGAEQVERGEDDHETHGGDGDGGASGAGGGRGRIVDVDGMGGDVH